jgi:hypothetical protein
MTDHPPHLPPVYFNHLYTVLDDKTYRAIQGSDFLQTAFPGKEKRSTLTGAGETWTGTYFYCQDNYLEFFGSGNGPVTGVATRGGHWQTGAQEGWAGLAFSVDRPGEAAMVRDAIREEYGYEPFYELRQMRTGEQAVNWFYNLKLVEPLGLGSFDTWIMEYHPDIFAYKDISVPASGALSRQAYLSPWNKERFPVKGKENLPKQAEPPGQEDAPTADSTVGNHTIRKTESGSRTPARNSPRSVAVQSGFLAEPVFSRVIGATLHMDPRPAKHFARIMNLLGYAKHIAGDEMTISGHGFTLKILPEDFGPQGYRLSSLRLAMSRPSVAPMTFVFAPGSRLVLNDDLTADWEFGL